MSCAQRKRLKGLPFSRATIRTKRQAPFDVKPTAHRTGRVYTTHNAGSPNENFGAKGRSHMISRKILLAVSFLTISFQALAQTQAINGSIRGRATDPSGAPVPAATVTVDNIATGYTRDVQTNDEGYFVIPNLPLGTYTVSIKKEGFETQRHTGVVLDAGTE